MEDNFDISGEKTLQDKLTAIKNLAKSYDMRIRGFSWDTSNESWIPSGKALTGKDFITATTGILTSFSESVNLITNKSEEKFLMEFADAFYRVNTMIVNDMTIKTENYRSVIKMFKDTLSNIGDVITGSKESLVKIFNSENDNKGGVEYD